jgi:hypothetical protein
MPAFSFSIGRYSPITPVEETITSPLGAPSWRTMATSARTSSYPREPVQALALPLLTSTWLTLPPSEATFRSYRTGAALTAFWVKALNTWAGGSEIRTPKSGLPFFLMPQESPRAWNPLGNVTFSMMASLLRPKNPENLQNR